MFKGSIIHCYVSLPECNWKTIRLPLGDIHGGDPNHLRVLGWSSKYPSENCWKMNFLLGKRPIFRCYCWWNKSCTSWYGKYHIIYQVFYIPGGWALGIFSINSMSVSSREIKTHVFRSPQDSFFFVFSWLSKGPDPPKATFAGPNKALLRETTGLHSPEK